MSEGPRRRYRFKVEYDGSDFFGWQIQPGRRTIQGHLEEAFSTLLREKITIIGAGRTDSGVHALGQVAHFDASGAPLDAQALTGRLNGYLDPDVSIRDLRRAPRRFHARASATGRRYRYHLAFRKSPLLRARAWYTPGEVDPGILRAETDALLGKHDFRAFCARSGRGQNTECEIRVAEWKAWADGVYLEIEGDRFLHHMVRNLIGTLVPIARGRWPGPTVPEILAGGDRRLAGPTAPARGLCLVHVYYRPRPDARAAP